MRETRTFFPELDGTSIRVGITRSAAGFASREEPWIWINPRELTLHTIAHELTHLLQNIERVPKGEKSADLFALARHRSLVDDLPCYLRIPAPLRRTWKQDPERIGTLVHRTARDAVAERDRGVRQYLRWFEKTLEERWAETDREKAPAPVSFHQVDLFAGTHAP